MKFFVTISLIVQDINTLFTFLCPVVAVLVNHINGEGEESKP
jgi:hypothetical protein